MPSRLRAPCVLLGLLLCLVAYAAYALTFPALTGRVVDDAGILDPATKAALERKLAELETKTTGQLVVVALQSLQGTSIEDYGYQRYISTRQAFLRPGKLPLADHSQPLNAPRRWL